MKRGRPFESGNTFGRGRPKGSHNRRTLEAQALFDEYKEPIIKKCIAQALAGDVRAIGLCVERILAPQRDPAVRVRFKKLERPKDIELATERLIEDLGKGKVTPQEAQTIYGMLADIRNHRETEEMESRIAVLEQTARDRNPDGTSPG
jgi:hypothetical protein